MLNKQNQIATGLFKGFVLFHYQAVGLVFRFTKCTVKHDNERNVMIRVSKVSLIKVQAVLCKVFLFIRFISRSKVNGY